MKTITFFVGKLLILVLAIQVSAIAQTRENQRLEDVEQVLKELTEVPDEGIPTELMSKAEAIVVVPKLKKAGFVVGGKFGRGIAMVKREDGMWSDPAFVKIAGGSFGLQIGYSSTDLFLIFKDAKSLENLANRKGEFTLGGDISVAAGPVGRQSSAQTDIDFEAEVYSYSKSRGVFAGISLDGSKLELDMEANEAYFGDEFSPKEIFVSEEKIADDSQQVDKIKSLLQEM